MDEEDLTDVENDKPAKRGIDPHENDLRRLLHEPWGRRLAYHLLEGTGMFTDTFTGNSRGSYLQGRASVGLNFRDDLLRAARDEYHRMLKENEV